MRINAINTSDNGATLVFWTGKCWSKNRLDAKVYRRSCDATNAARRLKRNPRWWDECIECIRVT